MPLKEGKSDDAISENISRLMHEGYAQDQAIAIAYKEAGRSEQDAAAAKSVKAALAALAVPEGKVMPKQIMVRKKLLHGNVTKLVRCDVLAETNGVITCKCDGELTTREVKAADATPVQQVFGSQRVQPGTPMIPKQYPASLHTLANMRR